MADYHETADARPVWIKGSDVALGGGEGGSGEVEVTNFPATQPVSAAALPLPTGAATAAKQPALGTAGAASTDVITVQGIASGTAQPVSGTVAVSNLPATQPVSAAALPLPSGASTSAKQPALGTAGTPSADVLTVQGIASGTAQPISAAALPLPTGAAAETTQSAVKTAVEALAALISSGSLKAVLTAGTAAFGKLAANPGVVIGAVELQTSTAALANVSASATSVTLLAANAARKGATIVNDSTSVLYVKFGSAASPTSYSYPMPGTNAAGIPSTLEVPFRVADIITGVWVSAIGAARITEFT